MSGTQCSELKIAVDDLVVVDCGWFDEKWYRKLKKFNSIILPDVMVTGLMRVAAAAPGGLGMRLDRPETSRVVWRWNHPLHVQMASHSIKNPVMFSSRAL